MWRSFGTYGFSQIDLCDNCKPLSSRLQTCQIIVFAVGFYCMAQRQCQTNTSHLYTLCLSHYLQQFIFCLRSLLQLFFCALRLSVTCNICMCKLHGGVNTGSLLSLHTAHIGDVTGQVKWQDTHSRSVWLSIFYFFIFLNYFNYTINQQKNCCECILDSITVNMTHNVWSVQFPFNYMILIFVSQAPMEPAFHAGGV